MNGQDGWGYMKETMKEIVEEQKQNVVCFDHSNLIMMGNKEEGDSQRLFIQIMASDEHCAEHGLEPKCVPQDGERPKLHIFTNGKRFDTRNLNGSPLIEEIN